MREVLEGEHDVTSDPDERNKTSSADHPPATPTPPSQQPAGKESSDEEQSGNESDLTEQSEDDDYLNVVVDRNKKWTTLEDENQEAVERLALKLRDRPLLPPDPSDPQQNWPEASFGIKFPTCHCAFKGCSWTSQRRPCDYRKPHHSHWHAHEGMWKEVSSRKQVNHTGFGCCEDPACLKSHIT